MQVLPTFRVHDIVRKVRRVRAHGMIDTGAFLTLTSRWVNLHKAGWSLIDATATHGYGRLQVFD
jgi:hypothetical protein